MKKTCLVLIGFLCIGMGGGWAVGNVSSNIEMLKNGSFEEGFSEDGVALEWKDNSSWAPVTVLYSKEEANSHNGKYSQKIECTSWQGGAVNLCKKT